MLDLASLRNSLRSLPPSKRQKLINSLSDQDAEILLYDWPLWARDDQLPPVTDKPVWLVKGGRGSGKTRTGAEWVRARVKAGSTRIALVAETAADARDVMVEGESGLLSVCSRYDFDARGNFMGRPIYQPSKRRITWANGAIATTYSAEDPEQLRGPQHTDAWCDEVAKWRYYDAWDQLMFGLRLGADPRAIVTTTPRANRLFKDILRDPGTVVTQASTYANRANLAATFFKKIVARFEGTRLGRQELTGDLVDDVPGALWSRDIIESVRVRYERDMSPLVRVAVGVDPAVTSGEDADETGIVVGALGRNGHGYVLEDASMRSTPDGWGRRAVLAYDQHHADLIVGETNNGGEMVEMVIRAAAVALHQEGRRPNPHVNFKSVRASRGKVTRAEPISALYEQGRVHHLGMFADLEDQQCAFTTDFRKETAGFSPDRLDAMVWALSALMLGDPEPVVAAIDDETVTASHWRS